jgi:hypothetical protein
MNATRPALIMQRWNAVQYNVLPELRAEVGVVTPKFERVIYVLEWARIEEFADDSWDGIGRPPHVRAWLANAFVAKAVLGITTTVGLVERLTRWAQSATAAKRRPPGEREKMHDLFFN